MAEVDPVTNIDALGGHEEEQLSFPFVSPDDDVDDAREGSLTNNF